jgi:pimeloyl-ACP methyl ester carboxylesterase
MKPAKSSTFDVHGPHGPLRVQRWGDPAAPVVVLVHGYPDNRSKWEPVARKLSRAYQVVAYDVRGAGDSFKPTRRADYRLEHLTADFKAVINAVSPYRPVHLVSHDWGSVQGWEFVTEPTLKGRIASFTSCSGPCLDHFGHWLRDSLKHPTPRNLWRVTIQMVKSWYVYMFQLPWLPEALWRVAVGPNWPRLMRALEGTEIEPRPSQTSDGIHGVGLYRANVFQRMLRPRERIAHAPVQVLVPTKDHFVSPWLSENLSRWVPQLTRHEIPAGHWVTVKQPDLFAQHVRSFIDAIPTASARAARSAG